MCLCLLAVNIEAAPKVEYYGKAAIGGPYVMVDQDGNGVTDATYRGKFTLLYFGFSHCPDICPSELVKVGKVMKELGQCAYSNIENHICYLTFFYQYTFTFVVIECYWYCCGIEKRKISDMVIPIYISLDPARDTIGQLKYYAKGIVP